jgi:alpha-ketoglutarate-dependent taurine dioxygenase
MPLNTQPLSPLIGSEVIADPATLLGGAHGAEIKQLLVERGVLLFRDVHFDADELNAFAATIGPIDEQDNQGGNFKVTMDEKLNPLALILYGTRAWHMDRLDTPQPPLGTLLSAVVLSPEGGETQFANTYAAYDALTDEDKALVESLEVEHSVVAQLNHVELPGGVNPLAGREGMAKWRAHPLVWRHGSGRRSLVLGWTADRVLGMDKAAGDALIARLIAHAEQPQFRYSHTWQMGDVVMWDNTGTMHRVTPFDVDSGRYLHRVTLAGEEPLRVFGR